MSEFTQHHITQHHITLDQNTLGSAVQQVDALSRTLLAVRAPEIGVAAIPQAARFIEAFARASTKHHQSILRMGEHYADTAASMNGLSSSVSAHEAQHAVAMGQGM